jgi:riboflavin kinase/FMN adenylyltransferase
VPIAPYFTRIGEGSSQDAAHGRSAVAIGNFDGVHRGHQAVLGEAIEHAKAAGLPMRVLTFDPHPAVVLGRHAPDTLTALPRKAELLVRLGVDTVVVKTFDRAFAALSPEAFVSGLLAGTLGARLVVVGRNFRFGHHRAGDYATLEALGKTHGFEVSTFELRGDERGPFSSTRVREAIRRGDVAEAAHVLGRPHAFSGVVATGERRGRTIGFPTANVEETVEIVPAHGVYAVVVDRIEDGGARALGRGVMNVGVRPTVSASAPRRTQEVHLFDFDGDLYGATLRVHVVERLREEKKFASLDELRAQIAADAAKARAVTASIEPKFGGAFG